MINIGKLISPTIDNGLFALGFYIDVEDTRPHIIFNSWELFVSTNRQ